MFEIVALSAIAAIYIGLLWLRWRHHRRPQLTEAVRREAGPSSYLIYYLSSAQKDALHQAAVTFAETELGGGHEKAVLFDSAYLTTALTALSARVVHSFPSEVDPTMHELILQFAPVAEPNAIDGFSVSLLGNDPRFTEEMKLAVRDMFMPYVRRNILIHLQPGLTAPVNDGNYHIFLHAAAGSASRYSEDGLCTGTAKSIWRAPVTGARRYIPSYTASGLGQAIGDAEQGQVVGEAVGNNCLYVLPDLLIDPQPRRRHGIFFGLIGGGVEDVPADPAVRFGLIVRVLQQLRDELFVTDHLQDALTQLILSGAITGDVNARVSIQQQDADERRVRIVDALVRNILLRVVGAEVLVAHAGGEIMEPQDDGRFHIFFGAAPSGQKTLDLPAKIFGHNIAAAGKKSFPFSESGLALADEKNFVFGELFNHRNLYLYYDPVRYCGKNEILLLAAMLLKARDRFLAGDRLLDRLFAELEIRGVIGDENEVPLQTTVYNATRFVDCWKDEMISSLVRRILLPVIKANISINDCYGRTRNPIANGNFHIFLYSSPQGMPFLEVPAALAVNRGSKAFAPSTFGLPLIDDTTGFIVGELLHQNLYLHYDSIGSATGEKGLEVFAHLLTNARYELQTFEYLTEADLEARLRRQLQGECSAQSALTSQLGEVEANGLETARSEFQAQMAKALSAFNQCYNMGDAPLEEFGREFDALHRIRKVTGEIKVLPDSLIVSTDILYCTDPRSGIRHEMGAFQITIPFDPRHSVKWMNNTRQVGGHNAPHVRSDGTACLGNMGSVFPALIAQHNFAAAIEAAIAFVEAVNVSDVWGARIDSWPVARG